MYDVMGTPTRLAFDLQKNQSAAKAAPLILRWPIPYHAAGLTAATDSPQAPARHSPGDQPGRIRPTERAHRGGAVPQFSDRHLALPAALP